MEAVMHRRGAACALVLLAAACGGDDATGPHLESGLHVIQGREATDTIGATLAPVIAQLADASGRPIANATVHFAVRAAGSGTGWPENYTVALLSDGHELTAAAVDVTTDQVGRARVGIVFGTKAGPADVEVSAEGASDVAHYTILPGRAATLSLAPADTTLYVGGSVPFRIAATDRGANPVAGAPTLTATGPAVSVSPGGAVVAQEIGRATIRAQIDGLSAQAAVSVVPRATIAASRWDGQMNNAIVTMELDGSGVTPIYAPGGGVYGEWLPSWSPNGRQVAFVGRYGDDVLHVATPAGAPQTIVDERVVTLRSHAPSYSPDGAWIYFAGNPGGFADVLLWRVRPDGTGLDPLTENIDYNSDQTDDWPSPSPDGTRLAFTSNRTGGRRIHLLNVATGAIQTTPIAALSVRWAPSGETLAYVAGGGTALHVVQADGSGDRTLLSSATWIETGFGWSPDGQWIIARVAGRLTLIRVADGLVLPLANSAAYHEPSWRPTVR